ncbi:phosphotransferase [Streptomyces sp. WMMC500]|uniref:phosphotransferase n=1 Tax=Streptomyces sp. WMMC500 TaxID=3015154 RepID=UPI00248B1736|nr:phosphotransferase [Streptomyces sp. WMMC500]WBB63920.1 phosphotransferase [Streptomyces sp. WMMC500]
MPMPRVLWDDLPSAARSAVQYRTGPVLEARTTGGGVNSGIATALTTASDEVFVKGVPTSHPQIPTQHREAASRAVPAAVLSAAALARSSRRAGTCSVTNDCTAGTPTTPGSPDLPAVAAAVTELQRTACPDGDLLPLKRADQRWDSYADAGTAELFTGGTLLHTDLAPHNVLVDKRAHLIDWAWPTRGAAWIDPAVLILRLMEAGHTAADADAFAHRWFPSWATAPTTAVTAFSTACARMWDEIARHDPQEWKKNMARLAHDWLTHWEHTPHTA